MEISSKTENNVLIVSVNGRIDAVTSPELESSIQELLDGGTNKLIMDLSELEYISSAGLRVILSTAKKLKALDGDILVANLQGPVMEVFEISGFSSIIQVFDSVENALEIIKVDPIVKIYDHI